MAMTMVFYLIFTLWPIIASIWYSFLDWSGMTTSYEFIALENYQELMHDQLFWNAMKNSFIYTLCFVPIEMAVSLFLAYQLNSPKLKGVGAYRTIYFLPVVTTSSMVGIIMIYIFSVNGPVNYILEAIGFTERGFNFLGSGKYAMGTLVFISVWKDCGTYMIYWLAGLQSVPRDLYEAATVDGASERKIFLRIVMPLIAPTAGVIAILCTINSLKVFDIVETMTSGGPFYATDVIATYVYRMAYSSELGLPRLGYASAAGISFGILIIFIGVVLNLVKGALNRRRSI